MDKAKADSICALLAEGKTSLRSACAELGVKHPTFLLWASEDPALADQYARAREAGTDSDFEALGELADETPERGPAGTVDPGWVAWKRLQVDTKKWELAKRAPKKYGDKIDLNHSGAVRFGKIECVVIDPAD